MPCCEFYLFDVDHGQSAALKLPSGRWCIFDVGCKSDFSPISWIKRKMPRPKSIIDRLTNRILKTTISHFHGDHVDDWDNYIGVKSIFFNTVSHDLQYLRDSLSTCSDNSVQKVRSFVSTKPKINIGHQAVLGVIKIVEKCIPVSIARSISPDANSCVNNASIITRIEAYGNSILLCGDMEKEGWDYIFNMRHFKLMWKWFLSDIDVLVAPHHGHASGFSTDLLNIANPKVVLASVVAKDKKVDTRYSDDPVQGITIDGEEFNLITTRNVGHIKLSIESNVLRGKKGKWIWAFGDDALS